MATWIEPRLLLLDEHTATLDPKSADQIIRLSEETIARDRLTTLMVTHSMHQAANLGGRLIMMYRGRIIHDFRGAEKRRLRVDDARVWRSVDRANAVPRPAKPARQTSPPQRQRRGGAGSLALSRAGGWLPAARERA